MFSFLIIDVGRSTKNLTTLPQLPITLEQKIDAHDQLEK